ncbi:MAG: GtrA-like protein [Bacteroidota bacterium]|jgi:putative flippase GtrA
MIYLRYVFSGMFTKIHSALFMILCVEFLKIPVNPSYVLSFFYSVYFNFKLNTHFTFKNKGNFVLYTLLVFTMLCINFSLFKIISLHFHYIYSNIFVSIITYPIHFFINKSFIFVDQLHDTQSKEAD